MKPQLFYVISHVSIETQLIKERNSDRAAQAKEHHRQLDSLRKEHKKELDVSAASWRYLISICCHTELTEVYLSFCNHN